MSPSHRKPRIPRQQGSLMRLAAYVFRYRGRLILLFLTGFIAAAASLAAPRLLGMAIDRMIGPGQVVWTGLGRVVAGMGAAYAVNAVGIWVQQSLTQEIVSRACRDLRQDAFDQITLLPLKYLDRQPRGDLISRLTNDVIAVSDGLTQMLNQLSVGIVVLLGSLILMLGIEWRITLIVLGIMPLNYLVTRIIALRSHNEFRDQAALTGEFNGYAEEIIRNQSLTRSFGQEEETQERLDQLNDELYEVGQRAQFYSSLTNPGTRFVNNIAYVIVGIVSALAALAGRISIGQVTQMLNYTLQFAKPINEISSVYTQLQNSLAGAERIFEVLDQPRETSDEGLPELVTDDGHISLDDVSFSYSPARPLITHLTLEVPSGAMVAIVGPTGAGKTTLVNLLLRFYDVDGGEIRIDDQAIDQVTRASLRRSFGMVLQDTWLFSGTVRQNIAYARPDASMEEVQAAAVAARADYFIRRLPQGYDTVLENGGAALSAGQRQLLTIARVMLARPEMLVLDEATSSIDTRTEILVQDAFLRLMEGRTSFIIAHRLSTIRGADHILVMEDGAIVEQGTHDSLLQLDGTYASLYYSQFEEHAD